MTNFSKNDWEAVRSAFLLDPDYIHIGASQFLSSHPVQVRAAIERHRDAFDRNPVRYLMQNELDMEKQIRTRIARYMGMKDERHIAITDSATMGLGTLYTGLNLSEDLEILTTEHNHYSHQESAKRAAERTGSRLREVPLYGSIETVRTEEILERILEQISDQTVILGVSWVHSDTGLKLPISRLAKAIVEINKRRGHGKKLLLIVDGVHGFGIETETFPELGCGFFITSCHKWLYGPRGTGFIAGTDDAWQTVFPVIPDYQATMDRIVKGELRPEHMDGRQMSPGGFHALEHRWALPAAFDFAEDIGREAIRDRVYELNRLCKEGLASLSHVRLITPMDEPLSAGITSFEIKGMPAKDAVKRLAEQGVIATESPYRKSYVRFTPGIINTPEDVRKALDAVVRLK